MNIICQMTSLKEIYSLEATFKPDEWPRVRGKIDALLGAGDGWNYDMDAAPAPLPDHREASE